MTADYPGACFFEVMDKYGGDMTPVNKTDLDRWTQKYAETFPVVMMSGTLSGQLGSPQVLPIIWVASPKTMKIVDRMEGVDPTTPDRIIGDCDSLK